MDNRAEKLNEEVLDLLWQNANFDQALEAVLERIGRYFSADLVMLAQESESGIKLQRTYRWSSSERPEDLPWSKPVNWRQFQALRTLFAEDLETVYWAPESNPSSAAAHLNASGVKAILQTPILDHDQVFAWLEVVDFHQIRFDWETEPEIRREMSNLAKLIGIFLLKTRYDQKNEAAQALLEKALTQSRQKAETAYAMLDSIAAGVIVVQLYPDGRARAQYANLGMYRILRIPRTAENAVVPDRSAAPLESEYFEDFFANVPESENLRVRTEYKKGYAADHFTVKKYRLLRGDGTYVWVSVELTLRDAGAGYRTYYATYTDMSEEQTLQADLMEALKKEKEMTLKLERASRAKSEFLSRMSHDIRTPMNAIMGMTQIAKTHRESPKRVLDALNKIDSSAKLLLSIINEVLDMSKVESGHMVLAEEEFNLAGLINGAVTMIQPEIQKKDLDFKIHVNTLPHEIVVGDQPRLQQLLINLLANAVKYTPQGGTIALEIQEIAARNDKAEYQFTVADSGIGMRPEFLEHIFEPFERADDERIKQEQGTGLGLAICKRIAELMHGSVSVESEFGKGSRFTAAVCLRVRETRFDDQRLAGRSVLVVDDDEIVCRNTCQRLNELKINADFALDGGTAIEKVVQAQARGQAYFAVILDLKMPGMDGVETALQLRREIGGQLPIIMISSYDLSEQIDRVEQGVINGFITKPLFKSRLVYQLGQFVESAETELAAEQTQKRPAEGKRILLVEDNALNREIACEILAEFGARVETAENGREAVKMVNYSPLNYYDLIFMDMQMPILDGCAATVEIRALSRQDVRTMPIIAMTANAFADDRQRTKDAGMNEHLAKPIDLQQLEQVLHTYLE